MSKTIAALVVACWLSSPAFAQSDDYPTKQLRVVSSYGAGGPNDVFSRILAQGLTERFGHGVIVENRTGADGRIGAEAVARAQPDGYTLLMLALAHTAHPSLYANMPYDVEKDFSPASKVASLPLVLVVNPSLPVKDAKAFIAIGKSKPGEINFT